MASEDCKSFSEAFRYGRDKTPDYQLLATLCQDFDFHRVNYESISRKAKTILFLISILPAFLELTKTQEIRQREVTTLLSYGGKVLRNASAHGIGRLAPGVEVKNRKA